MIALDTNILVYADVQDDPLGRHAIAVSIIEQLSAHSAGIIPLQALGEFLNVCRSKHVLDLALATRRVEDYVDVFETPSTVVADLSAAQALLANFNLAFFDALIITVAARSGAKLLLSEDMQDGLEVAGLRIVNPFVPANQSLIADWLGSAL